MSTVSKQFYQESSLALKNPIYKVLWLSAFASNIGTWMHEVGASWLMISLTKNPMLVALVQATTAFSVCLLALPAGALADILDKRRYLIILQSAMLFFAALLTLVTLFGKMSPLLLLLLTFCIGMGAALSSPTWQAIIPEIVSSEQLHSAITLNSVSFNVARAIGPAIAGFILAAIGPWAVFAINAASFLGIIIVLHRWKRESIQSTLPTERLWGAIRSGIRYVKGSPHLQAIMMKSSGFFFFAASIWALIPLIARTHLQTGPVGYGALLACLGVGAFLSALLMPIIRSWLNKDQIVFSGAIVYSLGILLLAGLKNYYIACFAMLLTGITWVLVISTLNTLVQQSVSAWVRARAISLYLMIFFGSMAIGGLLWGFLATFFSLSTTLVLAAIGFMIVNITTLTISLEKIPLLDFTPTGDSPAPIGLTPIGHEQGPVMITVEYIVKAENINAFVNEIQELRRIRLREGAFFWSLFQDIDEPEKFIECFMAESWIEHLRFHERVSISDRKAQLRVVAYHEGNQRPLVAHFVAVNK